jgi:hypothetical protein
MLYCIVHLVLIINRTIVLKIIERLKRPCNFIEYIKELERINEKIKEQENILGCYYYY